MKEYTPEELLNRLESIRKNFIIFESLLLEPEGEDPAALVVYFPFSCLG